MLVVEINDWIAERLKKLLRGRKSVNCSFFIRQIILLFWAVMQTSLRYTWV